MTTIKFDTEPVAFKCQGYEGKVDPARLPDESRRAVFEYGLRRWVQDRGNSAAKAAKDEAGADADTPVSDYFDAPGFVNGLIADLEAGKVSSRGGGMTDVEKVEIALARQDWIATLSTDKAKAARKLLVGEIRDQMAKIVATDPDGYRERAEAEIARRKAEADRRAEQAKKAASAVEKAGIDLDKLLG